MNVDRLCAAVAWLYKSVENRGIASSENCGVDVVAVQHAEVFFPKNHNFVLEFFTIPILRLITCHATVLMTLINVAYLTQGEGRRQQPEHGRLGVLEVANHAKTE